MLILIDQSYFDSTLLEDLFDMQNEASTLSKQSSGITQKFIDDWNRKWAEEIKRKEKPGEGVNFVFKVQKRKKVRK